MIDYEKFKQLNAKQKEEYNYRFNKEYKSSNTLLYAIVLQAIVLSNLCVGLVIIKEYIHVKLNVVDLFKEAEIYLLLLLLMGTGELIIILITQIIKAYKEKKFLKKCGVI